MGSDKASIEIDGSSMLERAVATLSGVFVTVAVAGGSAVPSGSIPLADTVAGAGPLTGLDAAYGIADGRAVFLMAVDMPFVDDVTVRRIAEPPIAPEAARVPVTGERRQPLCAVYGGDLGSLVRQHLEGDDRSMARLLSGIEVVEYVEVDERPMVNVNTAADLEAVLRELGPPRSTR